MARDILDECDIALAVRTQLIYPSGTQGPPPGHPMRWELCQTVLKLVESHVWSLRRLFPHSVKITDRSGGFPVIFFLRKDAEDALLARPVKDVCTDVADVLPINECDEGQLRCIKIFISEAKVSAAVDARIRKSFPEKPVDRMKLYLLREMLVHRILLLTLKKRWNVQYGLHPQRDPIAVPFHAKGTPSEASEFGHPDVSILFTCLSFYYSGLELYQLRQSLEHVLRSDDPSIEYGRWTQSSSTLPSALRDWNIVNLDNESQITAI